MSTGARPHGKRFNPTAVAGGALVVALAVPWLASAISQRRGEPFRAGIEIRRAAAYCAKTDNRLHIDARVDYGEIDRGLVDRYPRGRVRVRIVALERAGGRIMGRAGDADTIDYGSVGRRLAHRHGTVFGAAASRRALLYARGSGLCRSGTPRHRLTVEVEASERAIGLGDAARGPAQHGAKTLRVRVQSRACAAQNASDCRDGSGPTTGSPAAEGAAPGSAGRCATRTPGGQVEADAIVEASGLATSRRNADVLWTHNDSGDSARLFAMTTTGAHLGVYNLIGASAIDWEDMAIGPGPGGGNYLYVGDIGDNSTNRVNVTVYRVPEPAVSADQPPATADLPGVESVDVTYPDGPRDAETLMVDPLNGDLYVVSKSDPSARVYRLGAGSWGAGPQTLTFVGSLGWGGATAGDIAPDGQEVLIKRYGSIHLYARAAGIDLAASLAGSGESLPYTLEPQGEAVAFDCSGGGYFTLSEGSHPSLYYYAR